MSQARWFVGVLGVRSRVNDGAVAAPLVDLQYRVIHAVDLEAAYTRALELGRQAGQSYRNAAGAEVTWEFVGLHDLREVDDHELSDGSEVYSHIVHGDPNGYVLPKEKLSAFWAEANEHRTAQELLDRQCSLLL